MSRIILAALGGILISAVAQASGQVLDLDKIDGGNYQIPAGQYTLVKIKEINGGAVVKLDGPGVQITDVEIGLVDGKSTVEIKATGNVTFKDKIDGESAVTVSAGGTITVEKKIDGRSRISAKADVFRVKERIDGKTAFNVICRGFEVLDRIDGGSNGKVNASGYVKVGRIGDANIEWVDQRP